jgi:hypothetical protein
VKAAKENPLCHLIRGTGAIHGEGCSQPIQTIRCPIVCAKVGGDQTRGDGVVAYSFAGHFAGESAGELAR